MRHVEKMGERFDASVLAPKLLRDAEKDAVRYGHKNLVENERKFAASLIRQQQFFVDEKTGKSVFNLTKTETEEKEAALASSSSQLPPIYNLFAFLEHSGSRTDSGVYSITIECTEDGKFRRFDDDDVKVVDDIEECISRSSTRKHVLFFVYIRDGTQDKIF